MLNFIKPSIVRPLLITAISVVLLGYLAIPKNATNAQQLDAVSISVSPQSLDLAINPGESVSNVFRLANGSDEALTIQVTPKNFVPLGNEGAISLLEEDDDTPFSLASWISVSPSSRQVVEPRQTVDFRVTINVPENADPGGHFGSVVFGTVPDDQAGAVALVSQEIAPVILVKVPGDVTESAEISSFRALNEFITTQNSNELELIVKNTGNVHFRPSGNVIIKNSWGKQVATLNVDSRNVIPDAERKMNVEWNDFGLRFGRYTADVTLVYGADNQIITAQASFFVFPYNKILPVVLIVSLVGYVIYRGRKRIALAFRALTSKQQG